MTRTNYEPKPLFIERMKKLLGKDFESYMEILKQKPVKSLRVNTLKISVDELKKRFKEKAWKIKQPFKDYPEIMIVESDLKPGELGRALEHLLGYYYIQELASMLPIIALQPKPNETFLDLCSAPGSKTTQAASKMKNTGTIIANEVSFKRIKILASNLEKCGAINTIIIKKEGLAFCERMKKQGFQFDKILVDAPCSGEGTLRSTPKTFLMWNIKTVDRLSRLQKNLVASAWEILKPGGTLVYSTCTHAPEEDEEVVDFILKKFKGNIKIEKISLPIIPKQGIVKWGDKEYLGEVKHSCRIYPQDNNTEGFFVAKFKKLK
ncbi:RsmB/NOP family class I SAM-dependent RNA methyltransferase [Candidatus Pacearchaeota archaeon]|nr:RsmB/NOP family class I SAM-dependent RNA methyltransferase [Candidatus Pacearchaeota archaeon]